MAKPVHTERRAGLDLAAHKDAHHPRRKGQQRGDEHGVAVLVDGGKVGKVIDGEHPQGEDDVQKDGVAPAAKEERQQRQKGDGAGIDIEEVAEEVAHQQADVQHHEDEPDAARRGEHPPVFKDIIKIDGAAQHQEAGRQVDGRGVIFGNVGQKFLPGDAQRIQPDEQADDEHEQDIVCQKEEHALYAFLFAEFRVFGRFRKPHHFFLRSSRMYSRRAASRS